MAIGGGFTLGFPGMAPALGGQNAFQAGLQAGLQAAQGRGGDGFMGSPGLMDGRGPMGGLGGGFGNPMMGLGGFGGANPQQLIGVLQQLLAQLQQQQGQGMGGPGMGGPFGGSGFPGQGPGGPQGGPGPFLGGPQGPGGMGGPQGIGGPNMGGGQTIELSPGQTFTTPGGCTIHWDKKDNDSVKISEPGGGSQKMGGGGGAKASAGAGGAKATASAGPGGAQATAQAGGGRNFGASMSLSIAGQMGNQSFAAAYAAGGGAAGGPCGCIGGQQGQNQAPKNWKVWGDPHIDHPNGQKSDFEKKNAMFTLGDGSKVIMGADNPKGVVQRIQVVLPGGQPNWQGFDPKQTSVMQDQGGMFKSVGTADQFMGGGFGAGQGGGFGGF